MPQSRLIAAEDVSVTTEGPTSLNRSYDTATAGGRRTRSAAATARAAERRRIRTASSTSSVPSADDAGQRMATQGGSSGPASDAGENSDVLGRRRRRRRPVENEIEKETSLPAEQMQLSLDNDEQPMDGSFAPPADSSLLDVGSPRIAETIKTKKRTRKKPRGTSETSTADQESEPDLSISKDFSQSVEMRTSSPVQRFSFEPQPVPDATENKVSKSERDPNLWMMCDTRLDDVCQRLLADQNFDKLYPDDSRHREEIATERDSLKRLPIADNVRPTEAMEVDVKYQVQPTADVLLPETTMESPLKVKSQENQVVTTVLPVPDERPLRRKTPKHKKQVEEVPAEQETETRADDSRLGEDSKSMFSTELDTTENRNVPNLSAAREAKAHKSELSKNKELTDDVLAKQQTESSEKDGRTGEGSSQFSTAPDVSLNRNVPNILFLRESEAYKSYAVESKNRGEVTPTEQLPGARENDSRVAAWNRNVPNMSSTREAKRLSLPVAPEVASRGTSDLERVEFRGMPDVILSSPTVEPEIQAPSDDDDYDIITAEEVKSLERELEEEKRRQEQEQKERLDKEEEAERQKEMEEQQEREWEKVERRERKRQEKEDKERRRAERKEKKEMEKRQRELLENELPAVDSNEPQQVQLDEHPGSPALPTQDSGRTEDMADVEVKEPCEILQLPESPQQVSSPKAVEDASEERKVKTAAYDPYDNIPMVDDVVDEENIPPDDRSRKELAPDVEKSAKKKPPSGRRMPPRSPLSPTAVPSKPEDAAGQTDTLTYFRVTPPRTTLKETKARQRSRSTERDQSRRTGSHFTMVDIDIESEPGDATPASLSTSFDGGRPFSASDFEGRRSLRPARSEEMLFIKKLNSRSPTPSYGSNDSSMVSVDGSQWLRAVKSTDCLNRSFAGSESSVGLGRRSLSREWQVVTTTTKEEIVFVKPSDEDIEERRRIKSEYEKNKQVREMNEQRLTKEREKVERERLERLLAELKRRRQKERQKLLEKKMAEKRAKEENDRFIRQAVEEQRQKRLEEDRVRREQEQKKRDELNEKWRKEREEREKLAKETQERMERERQEKLDMERQLRLETEEKERQEREEEARRKKESRDKRETEEKERRERERKEKLDRERQQKTRKHVVDRLGETQPAAESHTATNRNVPNILSVREREAYKSELVKHMKQTEDVPAEQLTAGARESDSRFAAGNLNVPNISSSREPRRPSTPGSTDREDQARRRNEWQEEEKERRERDRKEREEKLRLEQMEKEANLLREKAEKERIENEARMLEEENKRVEKEREMREKLDKEHRLKLEKLEEETRLLQEQLEREKLEKEREIMEKLAQEHKSTLEKLEEETRLHQEQLERERLEKEEAKRVLREKMEKEMAEKEEIKRREMDAQQEPKQLETEETEKRAKDEKSKEDLERLEREALERIIQEQKLRLEKLECEEKLRGEKLEKDDDEEKEQVRRASQEHEDDDRRVGEGDNVFHDQPSGSTPTSPRRPRHPSQDTATQTDDGSAPSTVVGQVRHYPAEVVTERLVSDSESPVMSSPVPNIDHPTASTTARPADSPVRRRPRSQASADIDDDDDSASSVVVHEYGELLSFWRGDPTDGKLTLARANSRRAASIDAELATVRDFDLPPEQWSRSDVVEQPPNDDENQSKSDTVQPPTDVDAVDPVSRQDDGNNARPAAAAASDDRDMSDKSFVQNTLGWIGQYLLPRFISLLLLL